MIHITLTWSKLFCYVGPVQKFSNVACAELLSVQLLLLSLISWQLCFFSFSFILVRFAINSFRNPFYSFFVLFPFSFSSFPIQFLSYAKMFFFRFPFASLPHYFMLRFDEPMEMFDEEAYDVTSYPVLSEMRGPVACIQRLDMAYYTTGKCTSSLAKSLILSWLFVTLARSTARIFWSPCVGKGFNTVMEWWACSFALLRIPWRH